MDLKDYCEKKLQQLEKSFEVTATYLKLNQQKETFLVMVVEELQKLGKDKKAQARLKELLQEQKALPNLIQQSVQEVLRLQGEYRAIKALEEEVRKEMLKSKEEKKDG